jgi:hypothetical protein
MITSFLQLDHLLAAGTGLPSFLASNAQELLDILVLGTQACMFLALACGACLLKAFRAVGHICLDVCRSDPP